MKTKSMLVVAIALISSVAFANEPGNPKFVVVNQSGSSIYKVIYENTNPGRVRMSILDHQGVKIFTESIKVVDGFVRPVNFTGMASGEYSIVITDETGRQARKVNYRKESTVNYIHVSRMADDHRYLFTVANNGTDEINVRILDGASNQVHYESLTVTGSYGLVYNLKDVAGAPTFEITDGTGKVKTVKY